MGSWKTMSGTNLMNAGSACPHQRSRVDAKCLKVKFKETVGAEFKRHWRLGAHTRDVLE